VVSPVKAVGRKLPRLSSSTFSFAVPADSAEVAGVAAISKIGSSRRFIIDLRLATCTPLIGLLRLATVIIYQINFEIANNLGQFVRQKNDFLRFWRFGHAQGSGGKAVDIGGEMLYKWAKWVLL
jgi:hypothetical protein